jgi:glutathione S-transferase
MTQTSDLVLRYFAARGRAQFLRYYFRIRDIAFTDDEVPLGADFAAWTQVRADRALSGPFQKLPVLHCDGQMIAETPVIAAFVHQRFGDEGSLSAADNLKHAMLLSSLFGDVMLPIGMLLWADLAYVGLDMSAAAKRTLERLNAHWHNLERTLVEWQWFARASSRPVTAGDCLLWEELSVSQHVFGAHVTLGSWPELARFHAEFAGRAVCDQELTSKPRPVTGRPGEPDAIAKLQQVLTPST